jgi:hypothetical protein
LNRPSRILQVARQNAIMTLFPRDDDDDAVVFVDPSKELNAGLWCLFAGATILLGLRIWVKLTRSHGLWYDDYILVTSWVRLLRRLRSSLVGAIH